MRGSCEIDARNGCLARARGHRGFTLFELLVVFAIIGMLLAVTPFAFQRYRESAEYQDAVRTVTSDLSAARHLAMNSGRDVAFGVDLGDRRFGIEGRTPRDLPKGLDVRVTVADIEMRDRVAKIRFYPGGNSTGGSVEIIRPSGSGVRIRADWLDGRVTLHPVAPQ
jgi:general secretion pathway protein H